MKINFKIIVYAVLLLILTPLIYISVSLWYNGKFVAPDIGKNEKTVMTTELLEVAAKEFNLKDEVTFKSSSADPWFMVGIPHKVNTIVIDMDKLSRNCDAQIFYMSEKQELDEKNSVYFTLHKGKNYIQIPDNDYNMFRMDLASQKDVELTIKDISFYSGRVVPVLFLVIVVVFCGIGFSILYIYMFQKNRGEAILRKCYQKVGSYRFYEILLIIFMFVTILIVYGKILLSGNEYVYYDIGGGDGPEAYIPLFTSYINKIKTGDLSFWTFNNGLGTSMTGFWGYILNPFLLVVFVVGILFGIGTMNSMLLVGQMLNIICCGLLCYYYLNHFKGSHFSKAVAAYICSFNGYMILYAQHYVHSQFCFYLLVMLIIIEKMIRSQKVGKYHIYFALWCAVLFCCSVYIAYMIGLFSGVYVLFRMFQKYSYVEYKKVLQKISVMLGFACIGIMISMPLVLPVVNELLFNSDRITGSNMSFVEKIKEFLLVPYPKEAIKTNLLRLLSNNLEGAGNDFMGATGGLVEDYYAAPTLFFSVFLLVFVSIYYTRLHKKVKNKVQYVIQIVMGLLIAFLIFNRLGSATFNAFVATFGRYSYLLMPIFAIVASNAIDEFKEMQNKKRYILIASTAITCALLLWQYRTLQGQKQPAYLTRFVQIDILIVIAALILFVFCNKIKQSVMYTMFVMLVLMNVTLDSFVTVNDRVFCTFSSDLTDEDDIYTQDALAYVATQDDSMYRLEKDYYDLIYYHDAYFQNYRGISTYNSTLNANVKEFYRLYCNPAINFHEYDSFWYSFMNVSNDVIQNSLLGIRYIVSNEGAYSENLYQKVYTNDEVMVYKNKAAESFGIFYTNVISEADVLELSYGERLDVLSKAVVLEDEVAQESQMLKDYTDIEHMLNREEILNLQSKMELASENGSQFSRNNNVIVVNAEKNASLDIMFDNSLTENGKLTFLEFSTNLDYRNNLKIYFDTGNGFDEYKPYYYRGSENGEQQAKIVLPEGTEKLRFVCSKESFSIMDLYAKITEEPVIPNDTVPVVRRVSDSLLTGTINNKAEGYLFLPIPYEKGWSAIVDGKEVPIVRADSGFMAILLEEGEHEFALKYIFPNFQLGLAIAFWGIIILTMCVFYTKRNERMK